MDLFFNILMFNWLIPDDATWTAMLIPLFWFGFLLVAFKVSSFFFGQSKKSCCVCGWPADHTFETHYQRNRSFCREHSPIEVKRIYDEKFAEYSELFKQAVVEERNR